MKIDTQDVQKGLLDGRTVYICQYNQPDVNKKPLRSVPPTRVIVRSNTELPANKTIYYSQSHFCPIKKDGKVVKSRIISPVDNTGFRTLIGNPIDVFDNYAECAAAWNKQVEDVLERVNKQHEVIRQQNERMIGLLVNEEEL